MPNRQNLLKNATVTGVSQVIHILIFAISTPIFMYQLGRKEFAIIQIVMGLNAVAGFFELGIGNVVTKYISEKSSDLNDKNLKDLIKTSFLVSLLSGMLVLVCFFILSNNLSDFILDNDSDAAYSEELSDSIVLAGIFFSINILFGTHFSVMRGLQKFTLISKISICSELVFSISAMCVVVFIRDVYYVVTLLFLSQSFHIIVVSVIGVKKLGYVWGTGDIKIESIKKVVRFGGADIVQRIGQISFQSLDKIIVTKFLSLEMLPLYVIPMQIGRIVHQIFAKVLSVSFPWASHQIALGHFSEVRQMVLNGNRLMGALGAVLLACIISSAHFILTIWLDDEFARQSRGLLIVICFSMWFMIYTIIPYWLINAFGKPEVNAYHFLISGTIQILSLVVFIDLLGIVGAGIAISLSSFYFLWPYVFYFRKYTPSGLENLFDIGKCFKEFAAVIFLFFIVISFSIFLDAYFVIESLLFNGLVKLFGAFVISQIVLLMSKFISIGDYKILLSKLMKFGK